MKWEMGKGEMGCPPLRAGLRPIPMKSMTGFGRGEAADGGTTFRVEVSSVNRKQADIAVNLPRDLSDLELPLRKRVGEAVSRGRVTVRVHADSADGGGGKRLVVDEALVGQYKEELGKLGLEQLEAADLLRAPGVFSLEDTPPDPEGALPVITQALEIALAAFETMRSTEGKTLEDDMKARLATVRALGDEVRAIAPEVVTRYRENLLRRLGEAGLEIDLDDERVLKEVAVFAERCDITEELTRLESHLEQFASYMASGEPVGREMDFLSQELNREVNTIGSKANNADIAKRVVTAKAEIEKVREQVQNIE